MNVIVTGIVTRKRKAFRAKQLPLSVYNSEVKPLSVIRVLNKLIQKSMNDIELAIERSAEINKALRVYFSENGVTYHDGRRNKKGEVINYFIRIEYKGNYIFFESSMDKLSYDLKGVEKDGRVRSDKPYISFLKRLGLNAYID